MDSHELTTPEYYDSMLDNFNKLAEEAEFALRSKLDPSGIKLHTISTRVKEKSSYLEKIERKGYTNPREQVEDVVGLRVVCLFTSDLERIQNIIHSVFDVNAEEDKIKSLPADSFGYMSVHYICTLDSKNSGPRYDHLKNIKFEVQCRTILMDAWANVSHYLAYKQGAGLPASLKKDFHALSGLFHVADRQFESFYDETQKSRSEALSIVADDKQLRSTAVNRDTLLALLAHKYPDRVSDAPEDLESTADLAEELIRVGYESIYSVEIDLERADAAARAYEKIYPPSDGFENLEQFTAVGLARQALGIANEEYADYVYGDSNANRHFDEFRVKYLE